MPRSYPIAPVRADRLFSWASLLLFKKAFWPGLLSGATTLTFRRWQKPHVKPGGRYRCHPIGVLEVEAVELVAASAVTASDAASAGFGSRDELLAHLAELGPLEDDTPVYRISLHHGGDGDRVAGALATSLTPEEIGLLRDKLARLDASASAPWTRKTLALIDENPRVAASKLAAKVRRDTAPFKADVVKLKKLGLTQSFEVGYEIAPKGRAFLDATRRKPRSRR